MSNQIFIEIHDSEEDFLAEIQSWVEKGYCLDNQTSARNLNKSNDKGYSILYRATMVSDSVD